VTTSRRLITVVVALFLSSQAGRQQQLLLVVVVTQLWRRLDGETTDNKATTAISTPGRPLVESVGGRRLVGRVAVGRQGGCSRRANYGRLSPRLPCGVQQL
jgi:hypothetical protein